MMRDGLGIPAMERAIGSWLLRRWCRRNPPERSAEILRVQAGVLIGMFQRHGSDAARRVQIRRIPGLESSSTNYSLAMVADHLARVNRDLAGIVVTLARNERWGRAVRTADYKPSPGAIPSESLLDLGRSIHDLEAALANTDAIRASRVAQAHPWFGDLPTTTWACFAPFHQAIHLRQAKLIVAGL